MSHVARPTGAAPGRPAAPRGLTWPRVFAATVVLALVTALGAGYWEWRKLASREIGHAAVGEWVTKGKVRFRLDGLDHAPSYPAAVGSGTETAPAGYEIVRVRFRMEALDVVDPYAVGCTYQLWSKDGRELGRPGPDVAGPTQSFCTPPVDRPMLKGDTLEVQDTFLVPTSALDGLTVRITPNGVGQRGYLRLG